jgi:hypothetical protein
MSNIVDGKKIRAWNGTAWVDVSGKTKGWNGAQWVLPKRVCAYNAADDTWYCASGKPTLPQLVIVGSGGNIITNEDIPND